MWAARGTDVDLESPNVKAFSGGQEPDFVEFAGLEDGVGDMAMEGCQILFIGWAAVASWKSCIPWLYNVCFVNSFVLSTKVARKVVKQVKKVA